jgi:hypothetical protein
MPISKQGALGPLEVIPVDGPTSTTVKNRDREWLGLISRAFGRAGISHKAAAAEMEIDPGLLSAQLSGAPGKHLSWLRLGKLPPEFWQEVILLMCEYHEITIGQTVQERTDMEVGKLFREALQKASAM